MKRGFQMTGLISLLTSLIKGVARGGPGVPVTPPW